MSKAKTKAKTKSEPESEGYQPPKASATHCGVCGNPWKGFTKTDKKPAKCPHCGHRMT